MRINTNISAMNTYSRLTSANTAKSNSLAKLSSGLRINKAGDDAAGLAISEKMKNQISGMTQASRNAQDGISLIQTAEGALGETHGILSRIRELTVQASNDTNTQEDRNAIQKEITSLTEEVTRIADTTKFNNKGLMNAVSTQGVDALDDDEIGSKINANDVTAFRGAYNEVVQNDTDSTDAEEISGFIKQLNDDEVKAVVDNFNKAKSENSEKLSASMFTGTEETSGVKEFTFQIGANGGENISVSIQNMSAEALNLDQINVDVADEDIVRNENNMNEDTFGNMLQTIDNAIKTVSDQRADLGAVQNRLDHTVSNLATTKENLSAANSRIVDVDMAEEMMDFTKSNILSQAATSMLAQANQMPQGVLSLLG